MLKTCILFLLLLPAAVFAQTTITGRLINSGNKNGIAAASVFLSNTSAGNSSDANGTFTLNNVKNGQYDLVVTCVGYETYHQQLMVNNTVIELPVPGALAYTGQSVFENLTGTAKELDNWQKKRAETYLGSDMHFLRSCISDRVKEEGFTVRQLIRTPNKDRPADSLIADKMKLFKREATVTIAFQDSIRHWTELSNLPRYTQTLIKTSLNMKRLSPANRYERYVCYRF